MFAPSPPQLRKPEGVTIQAERKFFSVAGIVKNHITPPHYGTLSLYLFGVCRTVTRYKTSRKPVRKIKRKPIVKDMWGDEWSLFERRKTPYGFSLLLGRPYPPPPIQGGAGGTAVIVTEELARHLQENARRPYALPLPVGRDVVRRVRKLIGLDHRSWDDDRIAWWIERLDDLASMAVPDFVEKYKDEAWTRSGSLSEGRVWQMRIALLGRRRRPIGWWKTNRVEKLIKSDLPANTVADRLKVPPMVVRGLRWRLRQDSMMAY